MIISPPKAMECSLEPKEVKTIENCIALVKNIMDKMDEYGYSFLHISNDDEITHGGLTETIITLTDLMYIDKIHDDMY